MTIGDKVVARMDNIINQLILQLNRIPTEDEVMKFIFGSDSERLEVWNAEKGHLHDE